MFDNLNLKNKWVWVAGVALVIIVFALSRKGSAGGAVASGGGVDPALVSLQQSRDQNAVRIAEINSRSEDSRLSAGIATLTRTLNLQESLAGINSAQGIALAKINADENVDLNNIQATTNVRLTELDYGYDIQNKSLENDRLLGLTREETARINFALDNETTRTVSLSALDVQRELTNRSISSQEAQAMRAAEIEAERIRAAERVNDSNNRTQTNVADINGRYSVQLAKAIKPSKWEGFLGGLGKGLGGGLGSLLGGIF